MDEQDTTHNLLAVGEQLRIAREKMKLSLEDVASQTRIPRRHLENIEAENWDALPAPTYTIGFAKSYASAVGLDRTAIGDQLRDEIGGVRAAQAVPEIFEPADPARSMPKWLVIGAIVAVIVVVLLFSWLNNRSLEQPEAATAGDGLAATPQAVAPALVAAPVSNGPVVLTAIQPVWIRVYEKNGATLFERVLGAGEAFRVPPTAAAPLLRTGMPEALRITVGSAIAPAVGPAASTVSDVSLLGPDLMHQAQPQGAQPAQTQPSRATATQPKTSQPKTVQPQTANGQTTQAEPAQPQAATNTLSAMNPPLQNGEQ